MGELNSYAMRWPPQDDGWNTVRLATEGEVGSCAIREISAAIVQQEVHPVGAERMYRE
jgi:hypothetical protein